MNIREANLSGGTHVVILGAGASIASTNKNPEIHGLKLPSMKDLPTVVGLKNLLDHFPKNWIVDDDFEATYSNIAENDPNNPHLKEMNSMIYSYFRRLKLPNKPTIYDYLVMSLRDKDVIATFNWDPFLYQAWQRNYYHGSNPLLLFLHGNVAVGYNEKKDIMGPAGSTSKRTGNYYKPTQLLFPVRHKDYNKDVFIRREWEMLLQRLEKNERCTNNVTIFGYSAPVSDIEARNLMKSAWGDSDNRNIEQFEMINLQEEKEKVVTSWKGFIYTDHYDYVESFFDSSIAFYPRRTDEAYWCRYHPITEEESFVDANPVPKDFKTFEEMWEWYQPLIDMEKQ